MWNYKRTESSFPQIPEGKHRVRIASAEKAVSKTSGNDMLVIKLEVSGFSGNIWNYISFLPDRPEITNRMLTALFDSFDIPEGNFDLASYAGKAGAAMIKHDEQDRAKVSYFIAKSKQDDLPPWKDTGNDAPAAAPVSGYVDAADIPF